MKKYLLSILFGAFVFAGNVASAQTLTASSAEASYSITQEGEPTILKNFKATKAQKKAIGQVKRYVTPKVFNGSKAAELYEGKTVKVQVGLSESGDIDHVLVVKPLEPTIDDRVIELVKEFWTAEESAEIELATPTVIQLTIPVANRKYYGGGSF
ncbi:MAG: hypothetical protein AAF598_08195 [Bacteroidota bacterium]